MNLDEELERQFHSQGTAPFLFVGSGVSRRYLEIEDWQALLERFCSRLSRPFAYYRAKADGSLPRTASLMAEEFYDVWWAHDDYKESRTKAGVLKDRESCLKFEISRYVSSRTYQEGRDQALDKEVSLLKRAAVDGVITTNWDSFLESTFPDYQVYVGQEQVLFSAAHGIAEIYKIHGSASDPSSIVLTEKDYDDYNRRNAYLAARLLTTFVDHPVVFLGYSLSDPNILQILGQIATCLSARNVERLSHRLMFVQRDKKSEGDALYQSLVPIEGQNIPITIIRTNDFSKVYSPLASIKRRLPARLLRVMKDQVYELVLKNDPAGKIAVVDIEKAENHKDLEIVFGVGVVAKTTSDIGYTAIQTEDLLKDVVTEQGGYDSKRIVSDTLPKLIKGPNKYVPLFKYLKAAGRIGKDGKVNKSGLDARVAKAADLKENHFMLKTYVGRTAEVRKWGSIPAVVAKEGAEQSLMLIPLLSHDQLDVKELRKFIVANMAFMNSGNSLTKTYFRSLICLYDWIAFGPKAAA